MRFIIATVASVTLAFLILFLLYFSSSHHGKFFDRERTLHSNPRIDEIMRMAINSDLWGRSARYNQVKSTATMAVQSIVYSTMPDTGHEWFRVNISASMGVIATLPGSPVSVGDVFDLHMAIDLPSMNPALLTFGFHPKPVSMPQVEKAIQEIRAISEGGIPPRPPSLTRQGSLAALEILSAKPLSEWSAHRFEFSDCNAIFSLIQFTSKDVTVPITFTFTDDGSFDEIAIGPVP